MTQPDRRGVYWLAVAAIALAAAAGYAVYLLSQPACGAPGNTALGRSNRYVPWALIAAEIVSVVAVGKLRRRRASAIIGAVVFGTALATVAGLIVFVVWFGSGDCGD